MFNWTGHVLYFPRTQIAQALVRPAARHTGVYVLLGEDETGPRAYIGESENVAQRIRTHDVEKDFWTHAALITTQANNLHKAHVKYLEARLIEEAKRIRRVPLANANVPARPGLSEAAQANMEEFLATLFIVLPALRIDVFVDSARNEPNIGDPRRAAENDPVFFIRGKGTGADARVRLVNGEFVVEKGSFTRGKIDDARHPTVKKLRKELFERGVLVEDGDRLRFAEPYAFPTPSGASGAILGYGNSGFEQWKTEDGTSYREWEAAQLARLPQEAE
ncbi:GIY-YIG nuclease family protein [Paenirhodobacter sp.]|uniref:GIY-YIG nuclease family protein n=1 Tax=Paenirhodobacter sp. TaxID=1965326 RepID=UPI003D0B7AEE